MERAPHLNLVQAVEERRRLYRRGADLLAGALVPEFLERSSHYRELAERFRVLAAAEESVVVAGLLSTSAELFDNEADWLQSVCLNIAPENLSQ
jgi:hypothetical protein